jgi:hypothetical protein
MVAFLLCVAGRLQNLLFSLKILHHGLKRQIRACTVYSGTAQKYHRLRLLGLPHLMFTLVLQKLLGPQSYGNHRHVL